jgi:hypothetical protein
MGRFNYISDNGVTYTLKLDASNAAVFGAAAAPVGQAGLPSGLVPRYVLALLPDGTRRKIICPIPTHAKWVGVAAGSSDIALPDYATLTADVGGGITARIGEKRTSR